MEARGDRLLYGAREIELDEDEAEFFLIWEILMVVIIFWLVLKMPDLHRLLIVFILKIIHTMSLTLLMTK